MGRVSNHAKMEMDQANAVLGAAKQSKCCIMAASTKAKTTNAIAMNIPRMEPGSILLVIGLADIDPIRAILRRTFYET